MKAHCLLVLLIASFTVPAANAQEYASVTPAIDFVARTVVFRSFDNAKASASEAKELAASYQRLGLGQLMGTNIVTSRWHEDALQKIEPSGYDLFSRVSYENRIIVSGHLTGRDVCDVWFYRTRDQEFGAGLHVEAAYPIQPSGIAYEEYIGGVSMGWKFRDFASIFRVPGKLLAGDF